MRPDLRSDWSRDVGWRPWVLVVGTTVPVLVVVVAAVRGWAGHGLGGAYVPPEVAVVGLSPLPGVLDRLEWATTGLGAPLALTCAALGSAALAACRWAPQDWRVEGRVRRTAAVVALASALVGVAAALAGVVVALAPTTPYARATTATWFSVVDDPLPSWVLGTPATPYADAAAALVPAGICAAAAWVLSRREG
ncbi:hypothetical protein ACFEMC_07310 [Kineococcus sp. DHX-1]|uniref:hypothetical protein n=1 Tax=Kineococcus sp. DHX-1 TaxID=3349638 RepID=UPI0036D28EA3